MAQVKIWHYRDHYNGMKFNGAVYVDTNATLATTDILSPVKCRFRLSSMLLLPTEQCVWGMGNGDDVYSLKILNASDNFYLRVRYLDTDYDFGDLELNADEIYNVSVYISATPEIVLAVRDQYNNPVFSESRSCVSSGTLATSNLFVGATSDVSNAPLRHFTGTIFDFWYTRSSTHRRLVGYKNYGGAGYMTVKDHFNILDATVSGTMPSDFWATKTDISDQVMDISQLKQETDSLRTPVLCDMSFIWYGDDAIRINDTIAIEEVTLGKENWFYRVHRIEEQDEGLKRIYCESIFTALEQVSSDCYLTGSSTFAASRTDWWSNITPVLFSGSNYSTTEYFYDVGVSSRRWVSALYLLKSAIYFLQYDNILSVDTAGIFDAASDYTDSSSAMSYKWFAVSQYSLMYAGRGNKEDNDSADMLTLFRELLLALRLTFLIDDSVVKFRRTSYSTVSYSDEKIIAFRQSVEKQRKYYQVNQIRLSSGINYWDSWTSSDSEEISANNISSSYKVKNSVIDVNLTDHFTLQRHASTSNQITDISPALEEQLVDILDSTFRRDIAYINVKTELTAEADERYVRKVDDLVNFTSEIKQEA